MNRFPKKLIEVALPLDDINVACAHEKLPGIGAHPRSMHLWWARRPLAAARAILFSQLVNDPGGERGWGAYQGQSKEVAQNERERLFSIIRELVKWENTDNEALLRVAREEILKSWAQTCELNPGKSEYDPNKIPAFHDPFAGGGAIPLEAQRFGLDTFASDINPVAVLINKAMIEIPARFAGVEPVGPLPVGEQRVVIHQADWKGARGLAEDIRRYGYWMLDEARKRIGHVYPKIVITQEMAEKREDLKRYVGKSLNVTSWIWARTVKSPNPMFSHVEVPLASTFMLSTKAGKEAYVEPIVEGDKYYFQVKVGPLRGDTNPGKGTKSGSGSNFTCVLSGSPISGQYIMNEYAEKKIGYKMMAIVAEGDRSKIYISPDENAEKSANIICEMWKPDVEFFKDALGFRIGNYGMSRWSDLFTNRQMFVLGTLSELIDDVREKVISDTINSKLLNQKKEYSASYADAIVTYLAFAIDRLADFGCALATWKPSGQQAMHLFTRHAIPMSWDFPEANFLGDKSICFEKALKYICEGLVSGDATASKATGVSQSADAVTQTLSNSKIVSTDPPYYDNIGYADLSDFFYVWLRKSLGNVYPDLFATITTPKSCELVATPARHGSKKNAEKFFLENMTLAMMNIARNSHEAYPVTIYYAFKQTSGDENSGTSSVGWDSFLSAVIGAGFIITGTWPLRSEQEFRLRGMGFNALASSIVLVCRRRDSSTRSVSRRQFLRELKEELPASLEAMIGGKLGASPIAPVDLAQAAIGPGMAVFSRYASVIEADGSKMSVHDALVQVNKVIDEYFNEAEDDMDLDTRFCIDWFMQYGFKQAEYGQADVLARAKGTTVDGLAHAGVVDSGGGKVRLFKFEEYPADWDPEKDTHTPVWEALHQLIRALSSGGEVEAGLLLQKMVDRTESIRQLAYRLYTLCERKGWAEEARAYNELITSWHGTIEAAEQAHSTAKIPQQIKMEF